MSPDIRYLVSAATTNLFIGPLSQVNLGGQIVKTTHHHSPLSSSLWHFLHVASFLHYIMSSASDARSLVSAEYQIIEYCVWTYIFTLYCFALWVCTVVQNLSPVTFLSNSNEFFIPKNWCSWDIFEIENQPNISVENIDDVSYNVSRETYTHFASTPLKF